MCVLNPPFVCFYNKDDTIGEADTVFVPRWYVPGFIDSWYARERVGKRVVGGWFVPREVDVVEGGFDHTTEEVARCEVACLTGFRNESSYDFSIPGEGGSDSGCHHFIGNVHVRLFD